GNGQLTYRTLNARANQLARALLTRGLARESVVGVVTERNLDWMTAVLAIFKAGGVYLPFEPHFPPERIARMLSRAGCRLVLTERGSSAMLDRALQSLSGVETLFIDAACAEGHSDSDPGVNVCPNSSRTSISPPVPPESPRARCASRPARSTTSLPRSTI